jgi:CAAX protease family protein
MQQAILESPSAVSTEAPASHARHSWRARHPLPTFFALAYAISWIAWLPRVLGDPGLLGQVSFYAGGFGPLVAGAILTGISGGSVRDWAASLLRWRVQPRWYVVAIGVPTLFAILVTAELALFGQPVDLRLVRERLVAFVPMLLYIGLVAGANEEPGWRGSRYRDLSHATVRSAEL